MRLSCGKMIYMGKGNVEETRGNREEKRRKREEGAAYVLEQYGNVIKSTKNVQNGRSVLVSWTRPTVTNN